MISETASVKDPYEYPNQILASPKSQIASISQFRLRNRSDFKQQADKHPLKDRFYFKLKVMKNVGDLISNLKARVALDNHNLKDRQLSYLENQNLMSVQEDLFRYQNMFVVGFELLIILFFIANLWVNSFELVFGNTITEKWLQICSVFAYTFYLAIFFSTEIKNQKYELVTSRAEIVKYFVEQKLVFTIIIYFCLIMELINFEGTFLYKPIKLLSFMMLLQIREIKGRLFHKINLPPNAQIFTLIIKMLFKVFALLHFMSLLLNFIRKVTWVQANSLSNTSNYQLYLNGWYWSSTILSTVGFGDITPFTNLEKGVVSILEVISALAFGFFVNYIGNLIKVNTQKSEQFQHQIRKLNIYLGQLTVPPKVKSEIRSHFLNKNDLQKFCNPKDEQMIISNLNTHLKEQLLETNNKNLIEKTSMINRLSGDILQKVSRRLKKVVYIPEQMVNNCKDRGQIKLRIIEKGAINDVWNSQQGVEKTITEYTPEIHKNIVGWVSFVKNWYSNLKTKAKQFTILYEIERGQFFEILRESRSNFYRMMQLKDQMIENQRKYENRCYGCERLVHNIIECPNLHYKIQKASFLVAKQKHHQKKFRNKRTKRQPRSVSGFDWKNDFRTQPLIAEQLMGNLSSLEEIDDGFLKNTDVGVKNTKLRTSFERRSKKVSIQRLDTNQNQDKQMDKFQSSKKLVLLNDKKFMTVDQCIITDPLLNFQKAMICDQDEYFEKFNLENVMEKIQKERKNNLKRPTQKKK